MSAGEVFEGMAQEFNTKILLNRTGEQQTYISLTTGNTTAEALNLIRGKAQRDGTFLEAIC